MGLVEQLSLLRVADLEKTDWVNLPSQGCWWELSRISGIRFLLPTSSHLAQEDPCSCCLGGGVIPTAEGRSDARTHPCPWEQLLWEWVSPEIGVGGGVVIGHGAALCWWGTTATSFLVLSGFLIGGSTLAVPLKVPFYSHFQTHKPCFKFQEKHWSVTPATSLSPIPLLLLATPPPATYSRRDRVLRWLGGDPSPGDPLCLQQCSQQPGAPLEALHGADALNVFLLGCSCVPCCCHHWAQGPGLSWELQGPVNVRIFLKGSVFILCLECLLLSSSFPPAPGERNMAPQKGLWLESKPILGRFSWIHTVAKCILGVMQI